MSVSLLTLKYQLVVGLRLFINQISLFNYGIQEQTTELVLFSHKSNNHVVFRFKQGVEKSKDLA